MESATQNLSVPVNQSDAPEQKAVPFTLKIEEITKQARIELEARANYFEAQHAKGLKREAALRKKLELAEATIRDLKQRIFGKKSEKGTTKKDGPENKDGPESKDGPENKEPSKRKRGQQPGANGHGRTQRPHLPEVDEVRDLNPDEKHCPKCELPFKPTGGSEVSNITEVCVKAYVRKIIRPKYVKGCTCKGTPGVITAPPPPKVIPRSNLGVSVLTRVLLDKFLYSRPTHRLCQDWDQLGYSIAQGTLTGALKKLPPLFKPLVAAMHEKQMTEQLFHGDETRWAVFEKILGKIGYRWYLWVFQSASVIYYILDSSRGLSVPEKHFSGLAKENLEVVVVCDRYIVYKCLAGNVMAILLAFCWAHVRRDFLDAARSWPELEQWMFDWVDDIGELYHINNTRRDLWDEKKPLHEQSTAFMECHNKLLDKLEQMQQRRDMCLQEEELHSAKAKVLNSLKNHWNGLLVFVTRPGVPMDNNTAERAVRNPVTGRKNYYGSGSQWSAELAAMMFTVLQTVLLWKLNTHNWLHSFLTACAENGGVPPSDLSPFLPWEMSEERKHELSLPLQENLPSFNVHPIELTEPVVVKEAPDTS